METETGKTTLSPLAVLFLLWSSAGNLACFCLYHGKTQRKISIPLETVGELSLTTKGPGCQPGISVSGAVKIVSFSSRFKRRKKTLLFRAKLQSMHRKDLILENTKHYLSGTRPTQSPLGVGEGHHHAMGP